jgi:hypothetical protein
MWRGIAITFVNLSLVNLLAVMLFGRQLAAADHTIGLLAHKLGEAQMQKRLLLLLELFNLALLIRNVCAQFGRWPFGGTNILIGGAWLGAVIFNSMDYEPYGDALIFFTGIMMLQIVLVNATVTNNANYCGRFHVLIFGVLLGLLCVASSWHNEHSRYEYHHQFRWGGPWTNPNVFGLLMGCGLLLAIGAGAWQLGVNMFRTTTRWKFLRKQNLAAGLCIFAAFLAGRGLFHGYSRGAWAATLGGLIYLIITTTRKNAKNAVNGVGILHHLTVRVLKCKFTILTIGLSAGIMTSWKLAYLRQSVTLDRIFSAVDVNDFSWRNRVTAWTGAWQIIAEHPWAGLGWNQPERLYSNYYLQLGVDNSAALQMNSYLLLGATLGLPTLLCFATLCRFAFSRGNEAHSQNKHEKSTAPLTTICRGGAMVSLPSHRNLKKRLEIS